MLSHFVRKLAGVGRPLPAGAVVVRAGGFVWRVANRHARLFGDAGPDPAAWEAAGFAEVVKRNHQRTVTRVSLPAGPVLFVKLCRANTPRAWCRELLRPAKARLEFENAAALKSRGVSTVEAVAWAGTPGVWPGDSVLVTRSADPAVPFVAFLETVLPSLPDEQARAIRRQLARELAAFLAKMHDAGVSHPDPHPGNLLVELPPSRVPRFVLMDVHAVRFGPPLTWAETRDNLTLMNRWFQMRATRADRARFWRAYFLDRKTLPGGPDAARPMAKELEARTAASNLTFWARRVDRCVSDNREFRRVRGPAGHGFVVRDFPEPVLRDWLSDPDAVFFRPDTRLLKDSRSSTVAVVPVETPDGPRAVVVKRFRLRSWGDAVKNGLRPSEALRSWVLGHNLRDRGLPTARPLLMLHRRRNGLPADGYVAFEVVPDSAGLPEAVAGLTNPRARRSWAERIGRLVRDMHDRRVSHRDLKAPNVLMTGVSRPATAAPVLIDLVGVRTDRDVPRATRVRDLARLAASFHGSAAVSRTDRLRVLFAYLRVGLHGRAGWKLWWAEIDRAVRAKVARNERVGRVLG